MKVKVVNHRYATDFEQALQKAFDETPDGHYFQDLTVYCKGDFHIGVILFGEVPTN